MPESPEDKRSRAWIDSIRIKSYVRDLFVEESEELKKFGKTYNQTFEIFTFSVFINWYRENGWEIKFIHSPENDNKLRLKYSTKGKPNNYSYVEISKNDYKFEIRHNLRIRSAFSDKEYPVAVFTPDVSVITAGIINNGFSHKDHLKNRFIISLGEAKHLPAYSELVASFLGMVHEVVPQSLFIDNPARTKKSSDDALFLNEKVVHLFPTLFVSGYIQPSAKGVIQTYKKRGYRLNVTSFDNKDIKMINNLQLETGLVLSLIRNNDPKISE